jgi:hypothetical protein
MPDIVEYGLTRWTLDLPHLRFEIAIPEALDCLRHGSGDSRTRRLRPESVIGGLRLANGTHVGHAPPQGFEITTDPSASSTSPGFCTIEKNPKSVITHILLSSCRHFGGSAL